MSFYGKPDEPTKPPTALRTYTYKGWNGQDRTVTASYVNFTNGHVSFWQDSEVGQDTLVLAEDNADVKGLRQCVPS